MLLDYLIFCLFFVYLFIYVLFMFAVLIFFSRSRTDQERKVSSEFLGYLAGVHWIPCPIHCWGVSCCQHESVACCVSCSEKCGYVEPPLTALTSYLYCCVFYVRKFFDKQAKSCVSPMSFFKGILEYQLNDACWSET